MLPNKQIISRAISQLYPLEIQVASDVTSKERSPVIETDISQKTSKPTSRNASIRASKRIADQMNSQPVNVVFSYPRECRGEDDEEL